MSTLTKITRVSGGAVALPGNDIDTDRIIPARFLKCVTFEGLGEQAFRDERFDAQGRELAHPLNERPRARILVSGANFGCGSSREHAPQALYHRGLRALVAESFGEIFFGNSTAIGLVCATMDSADLARAAAWIAGTPGDEAQAELDLNAACLILGNGERLRAHVPENARRALREGRWDPLAELLERRADARGLEAGLPYPAFARP